MFTIYSEDIWSLHKTQFKITKSYHKFQLSVIDNSLDHFSRDFFDSVTALEMILKIGNFGKLLLIFKDAD